MFPSISEKAHWALSEAALSSSKKFVNIEMSLRD